MADQADRGVDQISTDGTTKSVASKELTSEKPAPAQKTARSTPVWWDTKTKHYTREHNPRRFQISDRLRRLGLVTRCLGHRYIVIYGPAAVKYLEVEVRHAAAAYRNDTIRIEPVGIGGAEFVVLERTDVGWQDPNFTFLHNNFRSLVNQTTDLLDRYFRDAHSLYVVWQELDAASARTTNAERRRERAHLSRKACAHLEALVVRIGRFRHGVEGFVLSSLGVRLGPAFARVIREHCEQARDGSVRDAVEHPRNAEVWARHLGPELFGQPADVSASADADADADETTSRSEGMRVYTSSEAILQMLEYVERSETPVYDPFKERKSAVRPLRSGH